jgi:hypothetical protein
MRSFPLHLHPKGPLGVCEEAVAFVRAVLLADNLTAQLEVSLKEAKRSRIDFHLDWQGGWRPTMAGEAIPCFIKPGHTSWNTYMQGNTCLGYSFGKKRLMARIYNKSLQMRQQQQDWYPLYLQAKAGEKFHRDEDGYRLEYELKREG